MSDNGGRLDDLVVVFGELLWDCLPNEKVLGGAPANFAFRLKELGCNSYLVSKVGSDQLGSDAIAQLRSKGVEVSGIQIDKSLPTGTVPVTISAEGNASYFITENVAYDRIEATPELCALLRRARAFCFGSLAMRTEYNLASFKTLLAEASKALKLLDINLRKNCWKIETLNFLLENTDILKLNDDEAKTLWQLWGVEGDFSHSQFCRYVQKRFNLKICVITRAERGVFASENSGEEVDLAGIKVEIVDTIGSGDAFTAAFLSGLLRNQTLREACILGNKLGAAVAATKGGMSEILQSDQAFLTTARMAL